MSACFFPNHSELSLFLTLIRFPPFASMKTRIIKSLPFIPLDTLAGTRYTIQQLRPLIDPYIDIQNDMVLPELAPQICRLLSGKHTEVLYLKTQQRGILHLINHPTRGLSILVREENAK
ncbi:hypothetical protein CWM47_28535 [Spirosoma pollinicola]|uniref:Uncharacterized protein n=1 Tax=Spirosoma pollinicola TaxID=2057025 RepID=A0A2K8Z6E7_9BACT|nr:hypothetical protein CWM47_28535 [Spirosoma pollinicola]